MIAKELIEPKSIAVIGASNDISKPGGRVLHNLIKGGYKGTVSVVNPKESVVQGIISSNKVEELDKTELAIIAIPSHSVPDTIEALTTRNTTKAFIVLSAGFSEIGNDGKALEERIKKIVDNSGGTLIGPNCIGIMNTNYKGVFTGIIPKLDTKGCDFVTSSGATAVFVLEAAIPMGITFSSLISIGNSAQIGVEDVLQYWDESFDENKSSRIKIIYIEQVSKPDLFLKHTRSLIQKGCRIAAIKAGTTDAGSRAVSSHTGALAGSDMAVDALFRKAGIVRCNGREELIYTAGIFFYKELKGNRLAVITHAGGPGVMITDTLTKKGMQVPHLTGTIADELKSKLHHGSSVGNPIDFLATGTPEQLASILEYVDNRFDEIDGSVVIFGTPGLFDVTNVYKLLNEKIQTCLKPIFPVLPSIIQAQTAIEYFKAQGRVYFQDEVVLGNSLANVYQTPKPENDFSSIEIDSDKVRMIIDSSRNGYLSPGEIQWLLDVAGIRRVNELIAKSQDEVIACTEQLGYPVVMKVVGPVHKSDVGGVKLNIADLQQVADTYKQFQTIKGFEGVIIQPLLKGTELFIGASFEKDFGYLILCGLGGIFVEVMKDVASGLAPINKSEAQRMVRSLKSYPVLKGIRGKHGVNEDKFVDAIVRLSALLEAAPEIKELDINPLLGNKDGVIAVDARIRIEK